MPPGPSAPPSPAPRAAAARGGRGPSRRPCLSPPTGPRRLWAGSTGLGAPSSGGGSRGVRGWGRRRGGLPTVLSRGSSRPGRGKRPPPPLPSGCGVSESARRAQFPFGVSAAVLRISIIKSLNLAVGGKRVPLRAGGPGVRAAHCLVPPSLGAGGMRWKGRSRRAEPRTRPCQRGSDPLRAEQTRIGCDIAAMSQQRHRSHSRAASRRSHRTRCGSMAAPWGSPVLTSGVHWWWRWILALMMKFVG